MSCINDSSSRRGTDDDFGGAPGSALAKTRTPSGKASSSPQYLKCEAGVPPADDSSPWTSNSNTRKRTDSTTSSFFREGSTFWWVREFPIRKQAVVVRRTGLVELEERREPIAAGAAAGTGPREYRPQKKGVAKCFAVRFCGLLVGSDGD